MFQIKLSIQKLKQLQVERTGKGSHLLCELCEFRGRKDFFQRTQQKYGIVPNSTLPGKKKERKNNQICALSFAYHECLGGSFHLKNGSGDVFSALPSTSPLPTPQKVFQLFEYDISYS